MVENDNRQERPHWAPFFMTLEWVQKNLNLTRKDRRELSEELKGQYETWPLDRLTNEKFEQAYFRHAVTDPLFPRNVELLIREKYPSKSHRKGLLSVSGGEKVCH